MKTQIGKGILFAAALAGLMTASAASSADSSPTDTCIRAFVAQELPQGHPVKIVNREMTNLYWNHQPLKKIIVKAKGKRTGKSYGAATCFLDKDGGLLAMRVEGSRIRVANESQAARPSAGG